MTNLTKRFTRDSMKRANPAASAASAASSGGSSVVGAAVAVDLSKAQIIQTEMARARARSLRTFDPNRASRNQQLQQQQQRMVAAVVTPRRGRDDSPAAEEGEGQLPHQHPNNHHNNHNNHHHLDDQSHSEILTTMSSLTEPTWAPSMSMDVPSAHQRRLRPGGHQQQQQQRHQLQSASASFYQQQQKQQQQQQMSSQRYQEHYHHLPSRPSTTHEGRQNDDSPTFEVDREGAKKSHGNRQVTTASEISSRGRDDTSIPPVAGPRAAADYATTLHTRNSELRDPPPPVMTAVVVGTDDAPAAASSKTKSRRSLSSSSSSRRSSKTITDDNHGGEVRRSKRSASTSSSTRHRSSSISSRRSSGTTAGTTTRIRSSSRARNNNAEATVGGEATAAGTVRRTSGRSAEDGGDSSAPASSSPLLSRRPRIYKSPTDESGIVTTKEERAGAGGGGGSGSGSSDDGSTVLTSADKEIANMVANNQISLATAIGTMALARARSYSHDNDSHSNNHHASSAGTLAPQEAHVAAAPHNRFVGGVTTRSTTTPKESLAASAPPKSAMEAARMSLRPTLHRSTSNRSMASSVQSEAIMSAASPQQHLQQRHTGARTDAPTQQRLMSNDKVPSRGAPSPVSSSVYPPEHATGASVMSQQPHPEPRSSSKASPPKMKNNVDVSRYNQQYPPQERSSKSSWVGLLLTAVWFVFKTLLWTLPTELLGVVFGLRPNRRWTVRRRTVLVTGASTAVGAEMARQLAMDGARLALVDWCRVADLEALAAECRDLGSGRVHCYAANLANPTSAQLAIQQASKDFGNRFDVVILNGDTKAQGCYFEEINDVGQIEQLLKQNVLGCCIALHHALPHVPKSRESRIVILSSTAGLIGSPYQSVYSATQHALTGFCQSLRMELNHTYSASKAPRVCLVSLPELASGASNNNSSGNNNGPRKHPPTHNEHRILDMGAALPPARGYSWAGIPLPHAVRGLLKAVALGRRDYGAPTYLTAWRFLQVWAPALVDWSIGRHVHQSHYRPLVDDNNSHQQHHYHNHNHNQNQNQNHNHSFEKKIRMGSRQQTEAVPSSSSSSSFFIDKIGTNPSNASNETWS